MSPSPPPVVRSYHHPQAIHSICRLGLAIQDSQLLLKLNPYAQLVGHNVVLQRWNRVCMRRRVCVVSPVGSYCNRTDCLNVYIGSLIWIRLTLGGHHGQFILEWLWTLDRTASRHRRMYAASTTSSIDLMVAVDLVLLAQSTAFTMCSYKARPPSRIGSTNIFSIPDLSPCPVVR